MSAFENATRFFHACESAAGWDQCEPFVEPDASFSAQCEPLVDIKTLKDYVIGTERFNTILAPDSSYELHCSSYDEKSRKAMFFGTFTGTHTGEGASIPPTGKQTKTDYVYVMEMSKNGKVQSMQKIWNANWSMKEIGWM